MQKRLLIEIGIFLVLLTLFFTSAIYLYYQGMDKGSDSGYKAGSLAGYQKGYNDGHDKGYQSGVTDGHIRGMQDALASLQDWMSNGGCYQFNGYSYLKIWKDYQGNFEHTCAGSISNI